MCSTERIASSLGAPVGLWARGFSSGQDPAGGESLHPTIGGPSRRQAVASHEPPRRSDGCWACVALEGTASAPRDRGRDGRRLGRRVGCHGTLRVACGARFASLVVAPAQRGRPRSPQDLVSDGHEWPSIRPAAGPSSGSSGVATSEWRSPFAAISKGHPPLNRSSKPSLRRGESRRCARSRHNHTSGGAND
jgi:hypothetical protein